MIARAAFILLGGFVASRVIGFLREALIGARFGTSADYDLYRAAFTIPDTIFTLVAGGALGSALIPVFAEYLAERGEGGVSRLAAAAFNVVAIVAGVAAVAGILFAPQIVPLLGPDLDPARLARLASLVRVMLLQPVFFGVGEVISRYLNVHQHFLFPAIAPTVYNLGIIAAALLLGPSMGTLGLAIGVTLGALAYLAVQVPAARRTGFRWQPRLDLADPGLRQVAKLSLPRLVGQGAVQLSFIVTARIALGLPPGRLSALNYAWVLMLLPLGTLAQSVAGAAFPTLADLAARGAREEWAATVRRTLATILFLMLPCAAGLAVAGLPLVATLLERGAFTSESSRLTAGALAIYALGLPAHGALEILARAFYSLQDTRTPVAVGVAAMLLNIALAVALSAPLEHLGIALAVSTSTTLEVVALAALLARRAPQLSAAALGASLLRSAAATAALVLAAVIARRLVEGGAIPAPLQLAAIGAAGGGAFLAGAYLLGSAELETVLARLRTRLGRRRTAGGLRQE